MNAGEKSPSTVRVREIFFGALEVSGGADRQSFVDAACGDDDGLKQQVFELLKEQQDLGGFLEEAAVVAPERMAMTGKIAPGGTAVMPVTEQPGDTIGHYKLLQKIGEGGCGVVYMAAQEQPVRRRVALKIIKLGMDTRQVIARFEAERQVVAIMDHPNIAKVLDAGATDTGRPFFVMELVRGIKITDYCDQNNLPTKERLRLFIQVCRAIQHAHQKGIIHRDIKPSNVLVTLHDGTPVPKVIDFGVAKATTHQRLTDKTVFTAFEQFIGTPAYMSPEQAEMSGLDIDTRSDIYSLGVLLYELLTGKTPFDPETLQRIGLDECRRTIRQDEPARPSNRLQVMVEADLTSTAECRQTNAPDLIYLLRGDLDWVVMKCLEKDRTRRYETVNALSMDVQRYLAGEPVVARPPTTLYRFHKFVRRHRGAFAASSAIAAILLAGAGLSAWLALRATRAERDANSARLQEALLRRQAENGWERAREKEGRARLNEYIADINLAQQSISAGNYGRAVQLLDKHKPQPHQKDLRGFEWRYLWQVTRGDNHSSLPRQESAINSISFSPSGDLMAVGLRDGINIWSLRSRSLVTRLSGSGFSVVFSPRGEALYASGFGGGFGSVRKWNTMDWSEQKKMQGCFGPIALSRNGSRLAVNSRDGIRILNADTMDLLKIIREGFGPVAFSPDDEFLATHTKSGLGIFPWNTSDPPILLEQSTNLFLGGGPWGRGEQAIAFSPDGKTVAAARNNRSPRGLFVVSLWDTHNGKEIAVLPSDPERLEHTSAIVALAFAPDGKTLATASLDHSVRLWDLTTGKRKTALQGHLSEVWCASFSPDGQTLATGAKDGGLKLWPVQSRHREDVIPGSWRLMGFSSQGTTLAALDETNTLVYLNVTTMEPEQQFQLESRGRRPAAVAVSKDLRIIAEGLQDGRVRLRNTETRDTAYLKAGDNPLQTVVLSPDGRELLTGGFGQPFRWWNLAGGSNFVLRTEAHRALFSPEGSLLALINRNGNVQLYDTRTHLPLRELAMESTPGFAAAFSPDARILAIGTGPAETDPTIQLWDTSSGRLLGTCTGHKQAVHAVAFAPDAETLASSSDDGTLKLWNVAARQELLSISRVGDVMTDLVFSPDGAVLAAGARFPSEQGAIHLHRAPPLAKIDAVEQNEYPEAAN